MRIEAFAFGCSLTLFESFLVVVLVFGQNTRLGDVVLGVLIGIFACMTAATYAWLRQADANDRTLAREREKKGAT